MAEQMQPDLETIAQQLRRPSGELADKIAEKMNMVNEPLFDLTLETMKLKDNEKLLEIGFGSGKYMYRLFSQADSLEVHGIDYSEDMARQAKSYNSGLIDSGQLKVATGSSDDLPYPDGFFDKVFCNMVIFFWDRPEDHLKEVQCVLKPGGKFYSGFRTKESMLQFPFTKHGFKLYSPEEWAGILERNNFEVVDVKKTNDAPFEEDGELVKLESVCMVAGKNVSEF